MEIEIKRKNIKNINLRICYPDGRIKMSVPFNCSDKKINNFIEDKKYWIKRSIEKVRKKTSDFKEIDNKQIEDLNIRISAIIQHWEKKMDLYCSGWQLKNVKSYWGKCNYRTKKIFFNTSLALKPPEFIEYVIVHELVHLKIPNHGKKFWNEVYSYMPEAKEIRKMK